MAGRVSARDGQRAPSAFRVAVAAAASPVVQDTPKVTLSFAKHINATGTVNLLAQDQARAKFLKNRASGEHLAERAGSIPVTNTAVSYTAAVGVGSPATTCKSLCGE